MLEQVKKNVEIKQAKIIVYFFLNRPMCTQNKWLLT